MKNSITVHIVAPAPMSEEEKERRVKAFHLAGWSAWNSLPADERLRINKEYEGKEERFQL